MPQAIANPPATAPNINGGKAWFRRRLNVGSLVPSVTNVSTLLQQTVNIYDDVSDLGPGLTCNMQNIGVGAATFVCSTVGPGRDPSATAGDPNFRLQILEDPTNVVFSMLLDNDDGDIFKMGYGSGATIAANLCLACTSSRDVVIHVEETAPADADIPNEGMAFYFNSAGPNTIEVKHRDSGGTVRTGVVASVT